MGLPSKQRTSRSRDERRSHHALKPQGTTMCEKCNKAILPHRACPHCGTYKGKQVVNKEKRVARTQRNKHV